ncbi:MAG: class I SAM-dependent methyltransferase [Burkholderiaceae bacterium]
MKKGGKTRLERFIARVVGQRTCIDAAAAATQGLPGGVWEVGLGNGRTYDHLRDRFAGRDIVVFDRHVLSHPDCIPPDNMLRLGDFRDTLPLEAERSAGAVVMIHADIGSGDVQASRALGRWLAPLFVQALAGGGYLVGDQPMEAAELEPIALATLGAVDLPLDTYFVYRRRN